MSVTLSVRPQPDDASWLTVLQAWQTARYSCCFCLGSFGELLSCGVNLVSPFIVTLLLLFSLFFFFPSIMIIIWTVLNFCDHLVVYTGGLTGSLLSSSMSMTWWVVAQSLAASDPPANYTWIVDGAAATVECPTTASLIIHLSQAGRFLNSPQLSLIGVCPNHCWYRSLYSDLKYATKHFGQGKSTQGFSNKSCLKLYYPEECHALSN